MTPQQFLTHLKQQPLAPAYLFLGPEPYRREYCRKALIQRALETGEATVTHHDLEETTLEAAIEDACSLSLFASSRVILISSAEAALPRGKAAGGGDEDGAAPKGSDAALAAYSKNPVPGVALVFEAARYDFQGEDKRKLDRVRKFYSAVPIEVEFARFSTLEARRLAEKLARQAKLNLGPVELDMLVETLGSDAARIASEIEKLRLYASGDRPVGAAEVSELVPEARASTIFALVAALGRNDRAESLDVLDTLMRQGEYLPLALNFLGTQFRLALAAKEAHLRSPQQVQLHFSRLGMPMWNARAEQVSQTVSRFTREQLAAALRSIYTADKSLRDTRPDDRVIMEQFILRLTG